MSQKTKIDWADATWNPVTGCLHGCEYCYARKIANRFKGCDKFSTYGEYHQATWKRVNPENPLEKALFEVDAKCPPINIRFNPETQKQERTKAPYPWGFQPTLRRDKLSEPQRWKKPRSIFVCSMADLFGWWIPDGWILEVMEACERAPQHQYMFLTKNPKRYDELLDKYEIFRPYYEKYYFGATATNKEQIEKAYYSEATWLSIEPIIEPIPTSYFGDKEWRCVVIGAETGNRKGKVIPKKEWIMNITERCMHSNIPVFMKESLRPIMGDDFRQDALPWQ